MADDDHNNFKNRWSFRLKAAREQIQLLERIRKNIDDDLAEARENEKNLSAVIEVIEHQEREVQFLQERRQKLFLVIWHGLSDRQRSILLNLSAGKTARQISKIMGINESAVSNHIAAIRDNLRGMTLEEALEEIAFHFQAGGDN